MHHIIALDHFSDSELGCLIIDCQEELAERAKARIEALPCLDGVEIDYCFADKPIAAIKHYRERTGASLKDAKNKVDAFRTKLYNYSRNC